MESAKLSTKIQILLWKGDQAPKEASQPRDHCQTNVCGIISDFAGVLCAAHAARYSLILCLSPSVVRMCANESALGLQYTQALHTSCFLPETISICSHDPSNPSPMGVRLFLLGINKENAAGCFGRAAAVCTLQLLRAFNDVFLSVSVGCLCKLLDFFGRGGVTTEV